jgi:starvation-inducible DNA-binding protein
MIENPEPIVEVLRPILANTTLLYLKTHHYHLNAKGANFFATHSTLDAQYKALVDAIDRIGERIKQLYGETPVTSEILKLGTIDDAIALTDDDDKEFEVYQDLARDNFDLANQCLDASEIAAALNDQATINLLGDRQGQHEEYLWRLSSMLPANIRKPFIADLRSSAKAIKLKKR